VSTHRLQYPYKWCWSEVQKFVEKYARGTYFLGKLLDLPVGEVRHGLTMALALGKSVKFEALKKTIKYLESSTIDEIKRYTPEERKLLYRYYVYLSTDEVLDEKNPANSIDMLRQNFLSY